MTKRPTQWRPQSRKGASRRQRRTGGVRGGQLIWLIAALGFILFLGLGEPLQTLDSALAAIGFRDKER